MQLDQRQDEETGTPPVPAGSHDGEEAGEQPTSTSRSVNEGASSSSVTQNTDSQSTAGGKERTGGVTGLMAM